MHRTVHKPRFASPLLRSACTPHPLLQKNKSLKKAGKILCHNISRLIHFGKTIAKGFHFLFVATKPFLCMAGCRAYNRKITFGLALLEWKYAFHNNKDHVYTQLRIAEFTGTASSF